MAKQISVCGPDKDLVFIATDDSICESLGAPRLETGGCAIEFTPGSTSMPDIRWSHDGSYRIAVCKPSIDSNPSTSVQDDVTKTLEETVDFYFLSGRNFSADVTWPTNSGSFSNTHAMVHMTARSDQGEANLIATLSRLGR